MKQGTYDGIVYAPCFFKNCCVKEMKSLGEWKIK